MVITGSGLEVVVDGLIYQFQARGGISRLFTEILSRIPDIDDSVRVTILLDGQTAQDLPYHPHLVHRFVPPVERFLRPNRFWRRFIPDARAIVCSLSVGRTRGKIWHSTFYSMPAWWNGASVVTVPDMIHERLPDLFNRPDDDQFRERKRRCIVAADAVICISRSTQRDVELLYGIDRAKLCIVPLACSEIFMQAEDTGCSRARPTQRPFLLYVGIRSAYKNVDLLLRAYSRWRRRREMDLILVGRPWAPEQKKELDRLGIAGQVHLLGYVDDRTLVALYRSADALVYPSLYEGFGVPLLEAMACGCPVIASRIPSTIEVAGECPIYFDPNDPDALITAFEIGLSEGRNSDRVRRGFEQVKRYSWDRTARETLGVYRSVS